MVGAEEEKCLVVGLDCGQGKGGRVVLCSWCAERRDRGMLLVLLLVMVVMVLP